MQIATDRNFVLVDSLSACLYVPGERCFIGPRSNNQSDQEMGGRD